MSSATHRKFSPKHRGDTDPADESVFMAAGWFVKAWAAMSPVARRRTMALIRFWAYRADAREIRNDESNMVGRLLFNLRVVHVGSHPAGAALEVFKAMEEAGDTAWKQILQEERQQKQRERPEHVQGGLRLVGSFNLIEEREKRIEALLDR